MKALFIIGLICGTAAITGCVSFSRDALWNAPITQENYCTYYREDFPVGSKFVHRLDDWTEYRIRWGYELKIIDKIDGAFVLRHGWNVFSDINDNIHINDYSSPYPSELELVLHNPPILVIPLHPENLKIGEFFKEYGQYQYVKDIPMIINGEKENVKVLKQLNESQELVAKPLPFIYFR